MMTTEPFRHLVADNWFAPELCRAACAEWPDERWPYWLRYEDARGSKYVTRDPDRLTPACKALVQQMLGLRLDGLLYLPDTFPDTSLYGAGMSMFLRGSDLPLHLDSDHNPITKWERAASAILYLSECDGGELQLWNRTGIRVDKWVAPKVGRLVIFECGDTSWHSVAPVIAGRRLALSLFFWRQPAADFEPRRPRAEFACEKTTFSPKENS